MSSPSQRPADPPLSRTPALEGLLERIRRRLVLASGLQGLGVLLVAAALWALFAFVADWGLSVPRVVRVMHGVLLFLLPAAAAWWFGWRMLRALPNRAHLALFAERADPDTHEELVSAVQFQEDPRAVSPLEESLRQRVLERAEARAANLDPRSLFDLRRPAGLLAGGFLAWIGLGGALASQPEYAIAFFNRMLGGDHPWPQRTVLSIEVPLADGRARVERESGGVLSVQVARGTDVPVLVRAEGQVPRDVWLDFGTGRRVPLAAAGQGSFRTVLPKVQENLVFRALGGDDRGLTTRVRLEVLQAPEILGVALEVQPPAHTGLPAERIVDRDARVVAGSRLSLVILTDPPDVTASALLLPENRREPLLSRPYPPSPGDAPGDAVALGHGFEFTAERSLRLRFELTDERGLTNPDPGLLAIDVVPDRPPEVELLAPMRSDVETTAIGAVALRVRAEDDFGLTTLGWRARAGADDSAVAEGEFELLPPPGETQGPGTPRRAQGHRRIDLADLGEALPGGLEGRTFSLEGFARDNQAPVAEGTSPRVRVRVLGQDELLRRVQERLGRIQTQATQLAHLQRERRARVEELLETLAGEDNLDGVDGRAVQGALHGQRRVEGDAEALVRELAGVLELALYARLDDKAGALLDTLDELLAAEPGRSFRLEPWSALVARAGEMTQAGFAGHLVGLVGLGLDVRQAGAAEASAALERASQVSSASERRRELMAALDAQSRTLESIEDLLERLSEWDDFQSVLALTRDLLERQRNLRERTRRFAGDGR